MDEFRVSRPGTHLAVEAIGRGPPMLVMPVTWGMDSHIYARGFSALQGLARLIFFDPRGVGDSGPAEEADLSLDTLVEDAEAVRQHLGVPRWTILGHSNGGYGALTYALRYPDRVERLILLDTAASREFEEEVVPAMRDHAAFPALVAAGERVRTEGTEDAFRAMMAATFAMAVKDPERFRSANEELLERMRFSPARLRHSSEDLRAYDLRARLKELRMPTLVVAGRHDLIVPFTATEALSRGIGGARFVAFEESGHWPFVEERDRFVSEVAEFLTAGKETPTSAPERTPEEIVDAVTLPGPPPRADAPEAEEIPRLDEPVPMPESRVSLPLDIPPPTAPGREPPPGAMPTSDLPAPPPAPDAEPEPFPEEHVPDEAVLNPEAPPLQEMKDEESLAEPIAPRPLLVPHPVDDLEGEEDLTQAELPLLDDASAEPPVESERAAPPEQARREPLPPTELPAPPERSLEPSAPGTPALVRPPLAWRRFPIAQRAGPKARRPLRKAPSRRGRKAPTAKAAPSKPSRRSRPASHPARRRRPAPRSVRRGARPAKRPPPSRRAPRKPLRKTAARVSKKASRRGSRSRKR